MEDSKNIKIELKEEFYDSLHSYEHRFNFLKDGVEKIYKLHGEDWHKNISVNKVINELIFLRASFEDLKKNLIPKDHPSDCRCSCVICGQDHRLIKKPNPYKCDDSGYCPYWNCC